MKPLADFLTRAAEAVNPLILTFAVLYGFVLAAAALSFAAMLRAAALVRRAAERASADHQQCEAALESLRRELTGWAAQIQEIRQLSSAAAVSAAPKAGLNLSKRSQALRMHRRGDDTVEIAASLGIPRQEVDLLLKVHRIVISNI